MRAFAHEPMDLTAQANATPEQLLAVLTHPQQIRRWSPVEFGVDDLESRQLAAGTRTKSHRTASGRARELLR